MTLSILVAINKSMTSKMVVDYLVDLPLCPQDVHITLFHVFRKTSVGKEMMGHKFMEEQTARSQEHLEEMKERLVASGFHKDLIEIKTSSDDYPTASDGIMDQFGKGNYNMVVLGRKRMTKAEEFVLGDPSIKLIRSLSGTAVLVIKGR